MYQATCTKDFQEILRSWSGPIRILYLVVCLHFLFVHALLPREVAVGSTDNRRNISHNQVWFDPAGIIPVRYSEAQLVP